MHLKKSLPNKHSKTTYLHNEKKWSQNGFCKTAPFFKMEEFFSLIIMVPLTKVVPFVKTAPQWSRFP